MFEDVCLVCGRIADGLYCSDVCRDADSVQLPPSSIDHAIDLGFITDSIPPLVHSQPTNTTSTTNTNTQDPSAVSSPTSSILTTPSLIDDLEPTELEREKEKEKAFDGGVTVTGDSFLLPPPTSTNHTASGGQKPPSSPIPPHFHLPTAPPSQVVSPRLQPTTAPLLPFARKPGNTNIHTPPPSTQHHHGSSASCSRAHSQAHNHRRTSSFNPVTITPTASPLSPTARGAPPHQAQTQTQISHTQTSSRCSTSGHASPALSPLRGVEEEDLIRKLELAAAAEDASADGGRHAESSIARKRRARQSLPAYFSNLMMNVPRASSSKVPSAAVSSGSSSDERKQQQRQPTAPSATTGQRIRHVRSKSAMRAADRAKASMTRSSSGVSVGVAEKDKENVYAQSPTTPTVLTRNASRTGVLAYFNAAMNAKTPAAKESAKADEDVSPPPLRGRDREKARRGVRGTNPSRSGRPINITTSTLNTTNNVAASWVEAIVSPITATRYSTTPPKFVGGDDLPGSFAERHIRFVAGGNAGRGRRAIDVLQGQLVRSPPPTTPVMKSGLPTPPPLAAATTIKDQSPSSPINIRVGSNSSSNTRGGRPRAGMLENDVSVPYLVPAGAAHAQQRLHAHHRYTGPTILGGGKKRVDVLLAAEGGHGGPKSRRYSSPTTSTAGIGSGLHVPVPLALMMSPAIERPGRGMVRGAGRREREEESVPQRPVVRRGWSPVRGRGAAVFDEDDDEEEEEEDGDGAEEADEEEEAEEEEEEQQTRGRSRSRIRSRSRARSRSVERRRFGGRRSFGVAGY